MAPRAKHNRLEDEPRLPLPIPPEVIGNHAEKLATIRGIAELGRAMRWTRRAGMTLGTDPLFAKMIECADQLYRKALAKIKEAPRDPI